MILSPEGVTDVVNDHWEEPDSYILFLENWLTIKIKCRSLDIAEMIEKVLPIQGATRFHAIAIVY
jgi:hypothetical protein